MRKADGHSAGESLQEQAPNRPPKGEEQEESITSLSRSSSSEGIWPSSDAVKRGYLQQRTSTIGMTGNVLLSPLPVGCSLLYTIVTCYGFSSIFDTLTM